MHFQMQWISPLNPDNCPIDDLSPDENMIMEGWKRDLQHEHRVHPINYTNTHKQAGKGSNAKTSDSDGNWTLMDFPRRANTNLTELTWSELDAEQAVDREGREKMGQRRRRRRRRKRRRKEKIEKATSRKQSHTVMHEAMDQSFAGWWTEGLARVTTSVTWYVTPSQPRSYHGETQSIKSQAKHPFTVSGTNHFMVGEDWRKMKNQKSGN